MKKTIFILISLVMIIVAGTVASCELQGAKKPPAEVTIKLKWVHQAQFAGNYVAAERGFYADEGLEVNIVPFSNIISFSNKEPTLEAVVDGKAVFGITGANDIIKARSEGLPVKAFAVIYKINPLCLYSLAELEITKPQDFIGKTVSIESGDAVLSYPSMMDKLGIDRSQINEIQIGYDATELLNGETDVSTGYVINEPQRVIELGYEVNIILFADYGVDTYADVLFATEATINNNPELVERFLRATLNGWRYAIENEEEAVDIVLEYATDRTRSHETYMLKQSIPLIHTGDSPIGWMERIKWKNVHDILLESGIIEKEIDIDQIYTMQFLEKIYGKGE